MRKKLRRRPEVETLESMTLLSGVSGVVHDAAKGIPNPLDLSGTVKGTLIPHGKGGSVKASGTLNPLGKVSVAGTVTTFLVGGPRQNLTVTTPKGKLSAALNLRGTVGMALSETYTITGGTKSLAGETGSGSVLISMDSGKFTATFS